jgi:hypothetical protein
VNDLATIERPGVEVTETTWEAVADLTLDQWAEEGQRLVRISRAVQWWLGDWLYYGSHHYGEKFVEAALATGFDETTLKNMQWVARTFAPERRRESLSWSHHREVAGLTPKQQDALLDIAEAEGWSHRRLAAANGDDSQRSPRGDLLVTASVTFEQSFNNEQLKRQTVGALREQAEALGFTEKA